MIIPLTAVVQVWSTHSMTFHSVNHPTQFYGFIACSWLYPPPQQLSS